MAKQPVLIKGFFFVDTDAFQHLSQWEKALMDFFSAHSLEMEKIRVLGASESETYYTVRAMDKLAMGEPNKQTPDKPKPSIKLLDTRKKDENRPPKSMSVNIPKPSDSKKRRRFSMGRKLSGAIGKKPTIKFRPKKK